MDNLNINILLGVTSFWFGWLANNWLNKKKRTKAYKEWKLKH